jgi:hypothetical protein
MIKTSVFPNDILEFQLSICKSNFIFEVVIANIFCEPKLRNNSKFLEKLLAVGSKIQFQNTNWKDRSLGHLGRQEHYFTHFK